MNADVMPSLSLAFIADLIRPTVNGNVQLRAEAALPIMSVSGEGSRCCKRNASNGRLRNPKILNQATSQR
jgi:hypothetical protein